MDCMRDNLASAIILQNNQVTAMYAFLSDLIQILHIDYEWFSPWLV